MYIWQQENWPNLTWDSGRLAVLLAQVAREQGRLLGKMESPASIYAVRRS